jgi:hypothetical protein
MIILVRMRYQVNRELPHIFDSSKVRWLVRLTTSPLVRVMQMLLTTLYFVVGLNRNHDYVDQLV